MFTYILRIVRMSSRAAFAVADYSGEVYAAV